MVTVGFAPDLGKVLIKLGGPNFDKLVLACKECRCHFHSSIETDAGVWSGVWTLSMGQFPDLVKKIKEIEPFEYDFESMGLEDPIEIGPETEYVRRKLRDDCFIAPPYGEYQKTDIRRLICQSRMYLAYDMGLGKTYTVITTLNHLFAYDEVRRVLILVPPESLYNFRSELLRFSTFANEENIYVATANDRDPFRPEIKVAIMTYNTFRLLVEDRYYESHDKKLVKGKNGRSRKKKPMIRKPVLGLESWGEEKLALVCDEAQKLGSIDSSQTKYVLLHRDTFKYRYLLSGSPAPNRPSQWYPQVKLIDASLVPKNYIDWLEDVAVLGTKWSDTAPRYFRPDRVKSFMDKISPWVIRRFNEVDLPPLVFEKVPLRLNESHQKLYEAFVEYSLAIVKKENDGRLVPKKVVEKFPFISQVLDDPCLLKGKIDPEYSSSLHRLIERWSFEDNSKMEALDSLVERYIEEQGKRIIVWSGHPLSLDALAERFARYNPIVVHGERVADISWSPSSRRILTEEYRTSTQDKHNAVERFKQDPSRKILIASYLVVSSAVNITQASRQIFWDRSWNFEYFLQAPKRSHRIGQEESVFINSLVLERTLSMIQDRILDSRGDFNRFMFDADSMPMNRWRSIFLGEGFEDLMT